MTDVSAGEVRDKGPVLLLSQRFCGLARGSGCLPRAHHLPGGPAVLHRPQGRRRRARARAHHRAVPGAMDRRADAVDQRASTCCGGSRTCSPPARPRRRARDRKFVPREGRVTGRTDIHDIGMAEIDGARAPIFVNTLFSCLATVSDTASFRPLWRPKFISALAPEDRCHLNGLAMDGARPAYVSAVSRSDVADGWRERRRTAASSSMWRAARSWRAASRCRTRRGSMTAGCGCSIPAPASSARSIARAARSRRWRSAPAMRAGSPSPAVTR